MYRKQSVYKWICEVQTHMFKDQLYFQAAYANWAHRTKSGPLLEDKLLPTRSSETAFKNANQIKSLPG